MILLMNYNIVSVVFLRNGLFFRKMNDDISLSTILTEYFSAPKYYSCHKFSQLSVCYLNNLTSGKVNKSVYDNKFICDERGPDLLLRKEVLAELHIYSKELEHYMHGTNIWTDRNQLDYRCTYVRFRNSKKYMLGNFIGINEYEIGHPQVKNIYITCKKNDMLTTHGKKNYLQYLLHWINVKKLLLVS